MVIFLHFILFSTQNWVFIYGLFVISGIFFLLTFLKSFIRDLYVTIKMFAVFVIFFLFYQKFARTCAWDVNRHFFLSSVWYLRISASSAVHTKYLFLPIFGPFWRLSAKKIVKTLNLIINWQKPSYVYVQMQLYS